MGLDVKIVDLKRIISLLHMVQSRIRLAILRDEAEISRLDLMFAWFMSFSSEAIR